MTNNEAPMTKEARNPNDECGAEVGELSASSFVILWSLVLCHSSF